MRRFVTILVGLAAATTLLVMALPWWLGFALASIGPNFGLRVGKYARNGYGRFAVEAVEVRRPTVDVKIDRIEADTPLVWLWHRWTEKPNAVVAGGWHVDVVRNEGNVRTQRSGWVPLQAKLEHVADRLAFWLPRAQVGSGVVTWKDGELEFSSAQWSGRTLVTPGITYRKLKAAATLTAPANGPMRLMATMTDGEVGLTLTAEGTKVAGEATWAGQRAAISGNFPEEGWRPVTASLKADHWNVPGGPTGVGKQYAAIRGDVAIEWRDGRLTGEVSADGEPADHTHAPPLSVKAAGHAEAEGLTIDALTVNVPGLTAQLSEPVKIDRQGRLRSTAAGFTIAADLARQPWMKASGKIEGHGRIEAGRDQRVAVEFDVAAADVGIDGGIISQGSASGRFEWPWLEIKSVKVAMADGGEATASGAWDFRAQAVRDARLAGEIDRRLLARWWPRLPEFEKMSIDAQAAGPIRELAHEGRLHLAAIRFGTLRPLAVDASWRGRGATITEFAATGEAGTTTIKLSGAVDSSRAVVETATLATNGEERLKLTRPAAIEFGKTAATPRAWRIKELHLADKDAAINANLTWGGAGSAELSANRIPSDWWRDLVALPATNWTLERLAIRGNWDDGPAAFSAEGAVTVELGNSRSAEASAQVRGEQHGLEIVSLRVAEGSGVILNAKGRLPLSVQPGRGDLVTVEKDGPFALEAETTPNPAFWVKLADLSGVEIVKPEVSVKMNGSWVQPRGEAQVRVDRIVPRAGTFKWPKIEGLDVKLTGGRDGLRIERGAVTIDGQAVRVEGLWPLTPSSWSEAIHHPLDLARSAELHVEVPDADMAVVARYFPNYLAPVGRLHLDATLRNDFHLSGSLRLENAASRPLGPLGILQDIDAVVRLDDRTLELEKVNARMGGQLVTLQGSAELREHDAPRLNLTLTGRNLPFVRKTGLLLRGDLDLALKTPESGQTELTGKVGLRDSLFLSDVRSLIPSGAKAAESRPPYFSIETPPMDRWRIAVDVRGDRFLRLQTTVFSGVVSARFKLSGTLGEPHATGAATINEGTVKLPFASFDVKQGQVTLTPDQPFEPQMLVMGTTRHYGYDLRMELSGPVAAPNLTFTSSPPLTAEQVVLMVMAGQAPQNEISATDRQRAARFGAFFGATLLGSFGVGGSGADRLTISSGENISEQGHETYSIEYRLSKRWSLTGEYDEFDDYNAGVKWRVYEKGGKKNDEAK